MALVHGGRIDFAHIISITLADLRSKIADLHKARPLWYIAPGASEVQQQVHLMKHQ
jgi:hypothetical protein